MATRKPPKPVRPVRPPMFSIRDLAEKYNIPYNTMHNWMTEAGAPPSEVLIGGVAYREKRTGIDVWTQASCAAWIAAKLEAYVPRPSAVKRDIKNRPLTRPLTSSK